MKKQHIQHIQQEEPTQIIRRTNPNQNKQQPIQQEEPIQATRRNNMKKQSRKREAQLTVTTCPRC